MWVGSGRREGWTGLLITDWRLFTQSRHRSKLIVLNYSRADGGGTGTAPICLRQGPVINLCLNLHTPKRICLMSLYPSVHWSLWTDPEIRVGLLYYQN
ncbi:hypothetical protein J6590_005462 [Homalodisca vitripennis]|nr:hypothetical protein J6590_005462 [Homalodisca vitripennis]